MAFESNGLKINIGKAKVKVSAGITKDFVSKNKTPIWDLRLEDKWLALYIKCD